MKHSLIAILAVALAGCASLTPAPSTGTGSPLARLAGDYDNHAQVWQAHDAKAKLAPLHVHQHIVALAGGDGWDWTLTMDRAKTTPLTASWRYRSRILDDGRVMLTPQRMLPGDSKHPDFATLAPCAMVGHVDYGVLKVAANVAACSAILPGLGASGALMPLRLTFDGARLDVATFADQARGDDASQHAVRVRWFDGWVAINGAGPEARADSRDWHIHRDLHLHDQGGRVPILWRDGKRSGYSIELERLDYAQRGTRVLKLSLRRDSDDSIIAYAWANTDASQIGLNLGWVQIGLKLAATGKR